MPNILAYATRASCGRFEADKPDLRPGTANDYLPRIEVHKADNHLETVRATSIRPRWVLGRKTGRRRSDLVTPSEGAATPAGVSPEGTLAAGRPGSAPVLRAVDAVTE